MKSAIAPLSESARNRSLRIGVDVRGLELESSLRRGIGRYVLNLLRAMFRRAPHHHYVLLGDKLPWQVGHLQTLLEYENVTYQIYWPAYARDLDILLLTDPLPVALGRPFMRYPGNGLPCATILYDLIPLAFEDEYLASDSKLQREYHERLTELRESVNAILTISEFVAQDVVNRLDISAERVIPILGGLDEVFSTAPTIEETQDILRRYGITQPYFFYTGGTDFRKNLPVLLDAFMHVWHQSNRRIKLVLAGEFDEKWKKKIRADSRIGKFIEDLVTPGYVSDEDLRGLYAGAVAFVFPSLYEGFGLPALEAMACGCPVIASDGSSLREIVGDAGILINPESTDDLADAMSEVLKSETLRSDLHGRGLSRVRQYEWGNVADKTLQALTRFARHQPHVKAPTRKLRVLLQNREDAFHAPGGDTVVMEQLYRSLREHDVDVKVAAGATDLSDIDIVHLVNLTVTRVAKEVAENAQRYRVPYAITTLFEDWPLYMERSMAAFRMFKTYIERGQEQEYFDREILRIRSIHDELQVGHPEIVQNAALLFPCGESEAERLLIAYPGINEKLRIAKFGIPEPIEISAKAVDNIHERVGSDQFVLCCGRLETRKNQLMLLRALEDSTLPVVLAGSGFTYQPAYAKLVAQYRRNGPVRIIGRLDWNFYRHLMAAAAVHVLPSWYELPGLVTLEAASAGTAIVASEWGALPDYLPSHLYHSCSPDDPDSIRRATEAALKTGFQSEARTVAESYTWKEFGKVTLDAYESFLARKTRRAFQEETVSEENKNEINAITEVAMNPSEKRKPKYDVSIIIPIFNGLTFTQQCLESISNSAEKSTFEVIVVDNHSTDDTQRILQALEGDAHVLRLSENRGFAAACNLGARLAQGENLVFLNNDTQVQAGWLDALVECAREDESIGAVGAKLLYPSGNVQHAGLAFSNKKVPYHVFQNFQGDHPAVNEKRDMQAVTAACMLVPKSVFEANGGFDEEYRNGFEDVDFCLRLGQQGVRIVYCPKSELIHLEESSEGRKDHDMENLERFLNKWESKIRPDETQLLKRHGYSIKWESSGGKYQHIDEENPRSGNTTQQDAIDKTTSLDSARARYAEGNLEGAASILQAVVEKKLTLAGQDSFETWQLLGNCLTRLSRFDEAEQAYHKAIECDSASERPYLGLGTLAIAQEDWKAAMYGFMTALAKNPNSLKGEFGVGLSMSARQMHMEAIERFKKVLEFEPDNREALFYLYRSAMESENPRTAIRPIQKFLEKHPDDTDFLFNLCGAYWKAGEIARAAEVCQQVLVKDPEHAAAKDVLRHLEEVLAENV